MDVDVPSMLLDQCPERTGNEFTQMRYTAATCDPNDFEVRKLASQRERQLTHFTQSSGYTLRQKFYDPPRSTELFIVGVKVPLNVSY
jgi:chitin synthase